MQYARPTFSVEAHNFLRKSKQRPRLRDVPENLSKAFVSRAKFAPEPQGDDPYFERSTHQVEGGIGTRTTSATGS